MRTLPVILCLCAAALAGCGQTSQEKPPPKPAEVVVTKSVKGWIVDQEELTGRTESKNMVLIKARVQGYLTRVNFKDGAMVKEGDVLFQIDPRLYEAEMQRAQAALVQNKARLERLEKDYQRAVSLLPSKGIAQEEFDKIKGDRAEADAGVNVAKAELKKAKQNVDFTSVTVPILDPSGKWDPRHPRVARVGRRLVDPGNLVKADETLLTSLVTLDPMYVYFDIDERTALRLRTLIQQKKIKSVGDMTFDFGLADEDGRFPYSGKVNFQDNKIDSGTGTLELRGEFANTQGIAPGSFVRVRLNVGDRREVILVPERALETDQGQKFLYVVKQGTAADGSAQYQAEYRGGDDLEIGALREGGWRVIERGVAEGESIIWSGLQRVRKDAKITPKLEQLTPKGL